MENRGLKKAYFYRYLASGCSRLIDGNLGSQDFLLALATRTMQELNVHLLTSGPLLLTTTCKQTKESATLVGSMLMAAMSPSGDNLYF